MVGAGARLSLRRGAASRLLRFPPSCRVALAETSSLKDEDCSGFLHWLQRKAETQISSVLSVGSSAFGRSLFALKPINKGDCIMEVPYDVQLTQDKLPGELHTLLDGVVDDTAKVAVLLMMVQHLGHESGWEPYVKSLPCKDQMHNMVPFVLLSESSGLILSLLTWQMTIWLPRMLGILLSRCSGIQMSFIWSKLAQFIKVIEKKDQATKEFSAVKPILECFPHLFGEVNVEGFMHASALVSSRAWRTSRGVSLIFLTMTAFLILYYCTMSRKMFLRSLLIGIMLWVNRL